MDNRGIDPARLVEWLPDALFVVDEGARVRFANRACEDVLGWSTADVVGRSVLEFTHPDDVMLVCSSMGSALGGDLGTPIEIRVKTPDGGWRLLEIIGRNGVAEPGIGGLVCIARDLTQRRMWEVAAGDVSRFQPIMQHSSAIVLLVDPAGVVTTMNGAFTRLLGHDPTDVVGRPLSTFATPEHEGAVVGAIADAILHRSGAAEVPMLTADGRPPIPIRLEVVDLLDDPLVGGLVVTGHDISELHEAKRHLEHLVHHDSLTGLPNRLLLASSLQRLLAARRPLAVLFIDLDRFKPVNDLHGHEAGDQLLAHVAERLRNEVSASDLVARVGGDEFVVVALDVTDRRVARGVARRLDNVLRTPFDISGESVTVSASIGFAISRQGSTVDILLAEADRAMYIAKEQRIAG